jgi:hypothetical protein
MYNGEYWFKRREIKDDKMDDLISGKIILPKGSIECESLSLFDISNNLKEKSLVVWVPIGDGPEDRYMREAIAPTTNPMLPGTFEFLGPKSQDNAEGFSWHLMMRHGVIRFPEDCDPPRSFSGLCVWMKGQDLEGIVWHHEDGRMAKIKLRDFGIKRGIKMIDDIEDIWPTDRGNSMEEMNIRLGIIDIVRVLRSDIKLLAERIESSEKHIQKLIGKMSDELKHKEDTEEIIDSKYVGSF